MKICSTLFLWMIISNGFPLNCKFLWCLIFRTLLLQVLEDLCAIWDWILNEKLHIPQDDRNMFSAIVVVPETFDSRGNFSFIIFPNT